MFDLLTSTCSLISALSAAVLFSAAAAPAQSSSQPTWQIRIGAALGTPDGWIQVREREIEGTRLRFRRDLNVRRVHTFELRAEYHPRPGSGFGLTLTSWALNGTATLPADVLFNGTTLAGGTALTTDTDFPDFVHITIDAWRRLSQIGNGGCLSGSVGLTAVLLTFYLSGTVAPTSMGHETKEDFVTQELPVPVVGLGLRYPISSRVTASAALSGGYLPWVNSLRREGGEVRLTQSHLDFYIGADFAITPSLHLLGGLRGSDFTQREKSREDGNDIHLSSSLLSFTVVYRF